jgi:hypothetical protein
LAASFVFSIYNVDTTAAQTALPIVAFMSGRAPDESADLVAAFR